MGYIWNLVKGDIERLKSTFSTLSIIFGKCDELRKKLVELEKLWTALALMVRNSEKQYKVDDEEKKDEGSVLDDEEKQHERSVLEVKKHERIVLELWLEELQDAIFSMEDLVDKIHTEALRHLLDGQIFEARRSKEMEDLRCSLESYVKQGDVLGLAGQIYNAECLENLQGMHHPDKHVWDISNLTWWRSGDPLERLKRRLDPTDYFYFVDESEVFGMDCDKEEIIKLLLSDDASDRQLSVISIEGNGRIGKTTLARLVYNEQRVSHHYHLKAWVRVPDDFDGVTRSILKFLAFQDNDPKLLNSLYSYLDVLNELNSDQLGLRLQQCLEGKRFLLVLDGAKRTPSSERWEALRFALKDAANGSCIIVTTRNKDIVQMMNDVSHFRMEPLSEEKSWSIFAKFAFGDQNPTPDTQLEVIGKEIVQMCHGLPSSVRILGSLLRFKLQREEWEAILKRLKPSSYSRENVNVIPADLILPEHLKRCLAYCSIFPQDYEFEKYKLLLLWKAEGFLERFQHYGSMEAADKSFNELNSFFQESSGNESSFLMHTRYCFRLKDNHPSHIPLNTRYLSLVGGKYENSVIFEAIDRTKFLRTFLAFGHELRHLCATELQNLLSKLQFLRVLSLSHYHITEIPDSVGNLKPLRYIDLSHTAIKRLPESVCELYNLQTLILSNCHSLTELPKNTSNLENLFYLDVSRSGLSEMPIRMHKLKNLKFLPCFVAGKTSGSDLGQLCHMCNLEGALHISKLQNLTCEEGEDILPLTGLHSLEELVLEWDDSTADPEYATKVFAGLIPSWTLEKLTIIFYCGTNFADFFERGTFRYMVFLRLSNCKNCSALPPLGKLETLRVLIIECMDAVEEVGPDFSAEPSTRVDVSFKNLERLTFEGMAKWTKWVPSNKFPCLKQLCIRRCPKLRGNLPKLLPSVERVEISESQELVTALTTEESLKILRYRDRIVSISSDGKETYYESERATGSSSLIIEGKVTKKPKETEERGETKEETDVEIQTTSKTNWSKHEQKESTKDPSQCPFLEEKSSLPLPQHATECSSLGTSGTEERGNNEQETHLKAEKAFETKERKLEQEEYSKEDPSSLFLEEKSLLPPTQDASKSTLPQPEASLKSLLPLPQPATECSSLVTQGIEERGDSEQETHLKVEKASKTKERKLEQEEYSKEDPSSLFLEEKSLLPPTQGALESTLPQPQVSPKSLLPMTHNVVESSLPLPQHAAECSSLVTQDEKSSSRLTLGATESLLPLAEGVVDTSVPITQGKVTKKPKETEERGEIKEETDVEIQTTSKTKWSKHEQKKFTLHLAQLFAKCGLSLIEVDKAISYCTVSLCISSLRDWLALPPLVELKMLRELTIKCIDAVKKVDHDFSANPYTEIDEPSFLKDKRHKPFQSLETLTFEGLSEWTNWVPLDEFPSLKQLRIRRCPKLRGNLPKLLPWVETVEISESPELVTALTTDASLNMNNLHYRDKIVFESDDKVTSSTSEGATGPSSLMIEVLSTPLNKNLKEISETEESGESDEADFLSDTWSNSSFESMKVSEISELMALPTPLHSLKIEGCGDLMFIPKSVIKNPSLQHLYIINCCSLESFPYNGMALKILYIRNCKKLYFPLANENIQLDKLEDLSVGSSCDSLTDLSLHLFPKLKSLSIWDCANLQKLSMPEKIQIELTSLEALEIRDCPKLEYFPTGGLPTTNLKSIWFSNCKSLKKLPDQLGPLKFLKSMFINDCPELESLSKQVLPSKLSLLRITSCNKLISGMEWGLHGLTSLCQLEIEGECKNVESFPVEGLLPSNLSSLCISKLSDLKKLDNPGLKKLESLKTLEISCCDKLQFLPEDGFPSCLSFLCIKECPLLKPKLQNKNGEDWYKIAHISCIEIDEEVIS